MVAGPGVIGQERPANETGALMGTMADPGLGSDTEGHATRLLHLRATPS